MYTEKFDFYDPTSLKIYDLDKNMRYQLSILDNLDHLTKVHSENVGNLCCRICQYLKLNKKFTVYATVCGYLHDIGKLAIPKDIIFKQGPLTDEEYEIMQSHTTLGYNMCMKDPDLRKYAEGALYHHEALNGTGYPNHLLAKDIPFVARIIRVADEYDALVTKRHYTTHVNISAMLKDLIKDANPAEYTKSIALDQLSQNSRVGKISPRILKALFKVVIDDIMYEINSVFDYVDYLKDNIKRLELVKNYNNKMDSSSRNKKKEYYAEGMKLLLKPGETFENYEDVLIQFQDALVIRKQRIKDLNNEIKIIKRLKV